MKKRLIVIILLVSSSLSVLAQVKLGYQTGYWTNFDFSSYDNLYNGIESKNSITIPIKKNWEIQLAAAYGFQYRPEKKLVMFFHPTLGLQYNFQLPKAWSIRPMFYIGHNITETPQVNMNQVIEEYLQGTVQYFLRSHFSCIGINLEIAKQLNESLELLLSTCYFLGDEVKPFEFAFGLNYIFPKK